jgi:hypothetical protein
MRTKSLSAKEPAERVLKDIRRATRRHYSAEDNIRIDYFQYRRYGVLARARNIYHRSGDFTNGPVRK